MLFASSLKLELEVVTPVDALLAFSEKISGEKRNPDPASRVELRCSKFMQALVRGPRLDHGYESDLFDTLLLASGAAKVKLTPPQF